MLAGHSPIRIGLVGYGLAGKHFHAPLIAATEGLELSAVVSSRRTEIAVDHPSVRALPSLDQLLADPAIELVVIASPDELHTEQALAALDAGKHVVVDKPLAPTMVEASKIVQRAAEAGLMLSVFHNRRWDADFLTLQGLLAAGKLGEVRLFESRFDRFRPEAGTRWKDRRQSGVWQDLGPHLVDQALLVLGKPLAISADLAVLKPGGAAIDHAQVVLHYANARASLHISQSVPDHSLRFAVHGTGGSFVKSGLDPQEDQSKAGLRPDDPEWGRDETAGLLTRTDGAQVAIASQRGDYGAFYRGIAAAIRGTGPLPVTPQEALAVMTVIEAGNASNGLRRLIELTDRDWL